MKGGELFLTQGVIYFQDPPNGWGVKLKRYMMG
jgi:hypothetical protein